MAIKCDEFTKDGDVLVECEIFDEATSPRTEITNATKVDLNVYDSTETLLVNAGCPIDMLPYNATEGKYFGVVPKAAVVVLNTRVHVEVVVESAAGDQTFHLRNVPVVEARPE